ncbi:23896_t:CDS:2, partial [Gigaspora margarita]
TEIDQKNKPIQQIALVKIGSKIMEFRNMDKKTQKIADQISYARNIAESKDKKHHIDNQGTETAILQTKDKESASNTNTSNKPQTKIELFNNIELEVTV